MLCGKKKSRVFDLEDREQLQMVANNLTHPKVFLKKCINAIEVSTVKKEQTSFLIKVLFLSLKLTLSLLQF